MHIKTRVELPRIITKEEANTATTEETPVAIKNLNISDREPPTIRQKPL